MTLSMPMALVAATYGVKIPPAEPTHNDSLDAAVAAAHEQLRTRIATFHCEPTTPVGTHRFNRSQQDVLLPDVENGIVILIGATTQNPFFAVNTPLLSRSQIFTLEPLSREHTKTVIIRALADSERGLEPVMHFRSPIWRCGGATVPRMRPSASRPVSR